MRRFFRFVPFVLLTLGCAKPESTCKEQTGVTRRALGMAPRNGAQLGGMTIDSGGVSQGSGAPAAAGDGGYGLIRIYVLLSSPGAGLSGAQQSALAGAIDDARGRGVQVFVRAYYQSPLVSKNDAAQTVASIGADIAALQTVLAPRLDAIPFIQAGFLGPWGEWWDGDLEGADLGTDQQLRTLKTGVVDALKAAFPSTFIQLRYPRDIATYYPDDPQIAFHNDSVLAGSDDGGTYSTNKRTALWPDGNAATQRDWIRQRSVRLSSVNAGEASEQTPDVSCDQLLAYLKEYRIFVFNAQWPSVVTKCSDQLESELTWSGPLAPTEPAGGGGAGGGGGGADNPPASGSVLGCWAADQRPWQLCHPEGCEADRCRRTATDLTCEMYRTAACVGTWPPPGHPGEETLAGGGGAPSGGGAPPNGGAPSSGGVPASNGGEPSNGGDATSGGQPSNGNAGSTTTGGGGRGGAASTGGASATSPGGTNSGGGAPALTPNKSGSSSSHDCL